MFRLSYNTWRRGLFNLYVLPSPGSFFPRCADFEAIHSKDEDYRWVVLRKQIPLWLFQITNLVFIGTRPSPQLNTRIYDTCLPY